MSKSIALGALILCASVFLQVSCSLEKANIVQILENRIANSSIIPFNGHLYTVSKNESHIHINSTDDSNYKICDIAIDPTKDVFHNYVEVRSTEDEIFVIGVQSVKVADIDQYTTNYKYNYTILKVNPKSCSYQSVFLPEVMDDNRADFNLPMIVNHQMGYDFFFPHLKSCAPCRVNNVGSRSSESTPQIPRENPSPKSSVFEYYYVQYVQPMNAYFYVYDSYDYAESVRLSKLKILNRNDFKVMKEKSIDFSVNAISKQKKSNGHLGVCTKVRDNLFADGNAYTEIRCNNLNSNLDTANTINIHIGDRSADVSSVSYEFDDNGNSYLSFAEENKLRLYIHNKDGKLVKAFDLGEVDKRFNEHPNFNPDFSTRYDDWDAYGFLVSDQYCIVTGQSRSFSTPLQQVRCVDVNEYVKH